MIHALRSLSLFSLTPDRRFTFRHEALLTIRSQSKPDGLRLVLSGAFMLALALLVAVPQALQAQTTFHVDADRSTPGSYATIQAAANLAQAGDIVVIHRGTYRETVIPANSGTSAKPIVFKAYEKDGVVDEVIIRGTEEVGARPSDWKREGGGIYSTPLPGSFFSAATPGTGVHEDLYDESVHNQANQVFFNDEMLLIARWPNDPDRDLSYPKKGIIDSYRGRSARDSAGWYTAEVIDNDIDGPFARNALVGAEIFFQPSEVGEWNWAFSGYVSGNDGSKLIFRTRNGNTEVNETNYSDESRFFLFNSLALLDTEGEWFHDKPNNRLYVYAPGGANPAGQIEVKKRQFAFDLTGKSYISIKNIEIFGSTITTDTASGNGGAPYLADGSPKYGWRHAAFRWRNNYKPYHRTDFNDAPSQCIVLDGLTVLYPTHYTDISGHFTNQWCQSSGVVLSGKDHVMRNSLVQYSAGNGITLMGRRHRVYDNQIYDTNYMATKCAAVHCGATDRGSSDHEIAFNTIRRTGKNAINLSMYYSTPETPHDWRGRVHHNDISVFAIQDGDSGGIYSGNTHRFVRVDHNWIHSAEQNIDGVAGNGNFTVGGVYPDYGSDLIIDHNVIWDVEWAIHPQNQRKEGSSFRDANYLIYNNTLSVKRTKPGIAYGPFGIATNNGNRSNAHEGTSIKNNIIFNTDDAPGYEAIDRQNLRWGLADISHNLRWDYVDASPTDPKFLDEQDNNYQIGAGSPARNSGVAIAAAARTLTVEVGGHADTFLVPFYRYDNDGAIDQGAYQFDQPRWSAGHRAARSGGVIFKDGFKE